jgi:hypothetical protein
MEAGMSAHTARTLPVLRDARGALSFAEEGQHVPFTPRRYFTISEVPPDAERGAHAHVACHQFFVCLRGTCTLEIDDGRTVTDVTLDTPALGIHAPPLHWCTLRAFSADALLLVLASDVYRADDYIYQYDEFRRLAAASE